MKNPRAGSTPDDDSAAQFSQTARLDALRSFGILDTLPERDYDDLTQLAAAICHAPISLISLIDADRQWFKSRLGLNVDETPLSLSFCRHAIEEPDKVMVISNAEDDARFCDHPLVAGAPHIRFYAGAPLVTNEGFALGTLCVIDSAPRQFNEQQQQMLQILARQVMTQLELRRMLKRSENHIQELQRVSNALRTSEARLKAFMDHGPAVTFIKDEGGCYLYANPQLLRRFEKTLDEFVGHRDKELWPREIYQAVRRNDLAVFKSGQSFSSEESVPLPDGSTSVWLSFKFLLHNADGKRLLGGIAVDITELKDKESQVAEYQTLLEEAIAKLEIVALTDSLTGLKNRGALTERLREEVRRARRYELPLSLAVLDVDFFKDYNDSFGHPAGDDVLRGVSQILKTHARPSDFSARYGGEEFVVILANTHLSGALAHAERIRHAVENAKWQSQEVTVSIGVASLTENITSDDELLRAADDALYKAKRAGRNRVTQ